MRIVSDLVLNKWFQGFPKFCVWKNFQSDLVLWNLCLLTCQENKWNTMYLEKHGFGLVWYSWYSGVPHVGRCNSPQIDAVCFSIRVATSVEYIGAAASA